MKKLIAAIIMLSLYVIILPVALLRIMWQAAQMGWEAGDDVMQGLVDWWDGE